MMMASPRNLDAATVHSFGRQWSRFDHAPLSEEALEKMFSEYFAIFPWERLPPAPRGADVGCGTGRWARLVAPRVSELHCVDASEEALAVARRNLSTVRNVRFHRATFETLPFEDESLDFAYSLGVIHHVPDTEAALEVLVRKLKKGAPLLLYLYYAFENRPAWYRWLWQISDGVRRTIARLPSAPKALLCDALALLVYWPLARGARLAETAGRDVSSFPLAVYRQRAFYSMRTDSRDRFGTPLEKRFRADEIRDMMARAGLMEVQFSDSPPYWCVVGTKGSPR